MIPALVDDGHRVSVFANSKEIRNFYTEDGRVSVHHFQLPSAHWYAAKVPGVRRLAPLPLRQLEWSYAFHRQVASVAASEKFDVLESTETGALFLSRIAPLVIRLHGSEFVFRKHAGVPLDLSVRWNDSLEAYSSKRAVAITTPSQFQADEIINHRGWPTDRVRVIPNPISATMLKAGLEFERNGASEPIVHLRAGGSVANASSSWEVRTKTKPDVCEWSSMGRSSGPERTNRLVQARRIICHAFLL